MSNIETFSLLIVDDEQRFTDMLARRLNLRGCSCDVSYSGQQALNVLKTKNFDLILLDLHLPDIYGSDVLKRIKETDSNTPVIIITGHGTEKDRKECLSRGAYAFMHKPVSIDKLMHILEQLGKIPI